MTNTLLATEPDVNAKQTTSVLQLLEHYVQSARLAVSTNEVRRNFEVGGLLDAQT